MKTILFHAGANAVQLIDREYGTFMLVAPQGKETFFLNAGTQYPLSILGEGWPFSAVSFQL